MADSAYILILDDDADVACAAQMLLRRRHGRVATLTDPALMRDTLAEMLEGLVI